jgi:hypothetical protein
MHYPKFVRIRQFFDQPRIADVAAAVAAQLERLDLGQRVRPGQTVALTAGSRGIANIPTILRAAVDHLKRLGARPFIVPAMGSHGGGTAEGQREIVESYGITEAAVGAPIRSTMDVVPLGPSADGYPVVLDRHAAGADHIGVIGRVKPHTGFHGPLESGLLKMMMIGLGKHAGAIAYHRLLLEKPYDQVVRSVGRTVLAKAPVAFGLAVVENARDETALVEAVSPARFEEREEQLLRRARELMPRLPVHEADLLVIDEIGKEISGSGMDTNVVGRKRSGRTDPGPAGQPVMRTIFVRGLSAHTHGNAAGIGLADFTTRRLVDAMDYRSTVINCLTGGASDAASIPVWFETDREVVDAALDMMGSRAAVDARVLHIRNTLQVNELVMSEPCLAEPARTRYEPLSPAAPLAFGADGNLPAV